MLYYCVCFEASSLVISGQPICLFLPSIPHHCTSALYCLPLSVQSCSTAGGFLNIGFFFLLPSKKTTIYNFFFLNGHTVPLCNFRSLLLYHKPAHRTPSSVWCLPACLASAITIYSAYSEALSVRRVHRNSAKECSVSPLRLHTHVCAVHCYLMCVI